MPYVKGVIWVYFMPGVHKEEQERLLSDFGVTLKERARKDAILVNVIPGSESSMVRSLRSKPVVLNAARVVVHKHPKRKPPRVRRWGY